MKRKLFVLTLLAAVCSAAIAQKTFDVKVSNPTKTMRVAVPVILQLDKYDMNVKSAVVTVDGKEIASQLDDLNNDGRFDELCFLTDMEKKSEKTFSITLSDKKSSTKYDPQVYVEMLLTNSKIKSQTKQNLYISSLTVENGVNPYSMLHHHGPAFENDMVAYRVYFDHRQTIDIYGKYRKGLELRQTQFYPEKEQKAAGYGDDILWVGQTFGLGALRGWNGNAPQMLFDVDHRTMKIVSRGPLRTIVEVIDEGWNIGSERIDMTIRYTLYAGRRDCFVDVTFNKPLPDVQLATGIINVKNSKELTDNKGLRGCWGTDWPVSEQDSAGYKRETVGLGISIPSKYIISELPANRDNYPFVIGNLSNELHYNITFCSDNENFGYHSAEEWFDYLKAWKEELANPVVVKQ